MLQLFRRRSFAALTATQFLGAWNDNVLKQFALLLAASLPGEWRVGVVPPSQGLVGALFALPFVLVSVVAGSLADRLSKRSIVVACKLAEVGLVLLGAIAVALRHFDLLALTVLAMGLQSAVFGPSKYGAIPEVLDERDLSRGNALIQAATFLAILGGSAVGGALLDRYAVEGASPAGAWLAVALLGVGTALFLRPLPARDPTRRVSWSPAAEARRALRLVAGDRPLVLAIAGGALFMLCGSALFYAVNQYGLWLGLDYAGASLRLAVLAVGIAAGSWLAGRLSGDRVESGLVPLGVLGMALSLGATALAPRSVEWFTGCLLVAGVAAGLFTVPIRALVQQRPREHQRGAVLGLSELCDFTGVLLGSALYFGLERGLALSPPAMLAALTGLLVVFLGIALVHTHEYLARLVLFLLTHTLYRIETRGLEHLPREGGALLVANHVSFADPFLLGAAVPRPVRFLMYRGFLDVPVVGAFGRYMRAIPIARGDPPELRRASLEAAADALRRGELVAIFAEGGITRSGHLQPFARGLERIARAARAPIVPVSLDRVWGSVFSFRGGRVFRKRPERVPYPVGVQVGAPLAPDTPAWRVHDAVQELGARALEGRGNRSGTLSYRFLLSARRHARRTAVIDSTGQELSYRRLLEGALALRRVLARELDETERVGVLLPPGAAGALVNVALALSGRVAVDLNYTLPNEALADPLERAGLRRVITSGRFLSALGRSSPLPPERGRTLLVEDLLAGVRPLDRLVAGALARLPGRLLAALANPVPSATRPATVLFSSGSSGRPKGVVLSHTNVLSNARACADVLGLEREDRVLGVLPFFHAFGYTVSLWAPLLRGAAAVYHADPLDAASIASLVRGAGITVLIATPTFLRGWLRALEPADVARVRLAVTGAERLPRELARRVRDALGLDLVEGYGCTELGPVVAVDVRPPDAAGEETEPGTVGRPLPGVAVQVRDPASGERLPPGREGELWVRGPGVMLGYLDEPERTAEVLVDGWYRTGDVARVDPRARLVLTDRLARFSKVAGEMVPHGRVEEALLAAAGRLAPEAAATLELAVASLPDEARGERLIVLHTPTALDPSAWLAEARRGDLPNLFLPRPADLVAVDALPKLGTGKLDLAALRRLAHERAAARGAR